jgi:hypothetical protein
MSTGYYEIDERCFQPFGENGPCLHWVFETYDSAPFIAWSYEIIKKNNDPNNDIIEHMIENGLEETKMAQGNPWNVLHGNQQLLDTINNNKPKKKQKLVTRGKKAVNFEIMCNNQDKKEISQEISDIILADCWSIYVRDKKGAPIKVYFDSREEEKTEDSDIRHNLADDPCELIDYMNDNNEVCFIMGKKEFIDIYAYKSANNEKYNIIQISYP